MTTIKGVCKEIYKVSLTRKVLGWDLVSLVRFQGLM